MTDIIKPAQSYLPEKQGESDLFLKISEMVDYQVDNFAAALNDVAAKYTDPSSVTREVVVEIFKENGLKSIVDLLDSLTVVDHNTVVAFSAYITLLKGSRSGYETVLRLLGFSYTMKEWWEEGGSGIPNTFSIDIDLNDSHTTQPYETFQRFKKFTSEYVFPIISPLGYTYVIDFKGPQIACSAAAQNTLNCPINDTSVPVEDIYGPSNWVVTDEAFSQNWVIKVNSLGQLKAFKTERQPQVFITLVSDTGGTYSPFLGSDGSIVFDESVILADRKPYVKLMDPLKNNWYIYITGFGELVVSQTYISVNTLQTEDFLILLQESGRIIVP